MEQYLYSSFSRVDDRSVDLADPRREATGSMLNPLVSRSMLSPQMQKQDAKPMVEAR